MSVQAVIPSMDLPSVLTTNQVLFPHPVGVDMHCTTCLKPQAHWRIKHPRYGAEMADICALCFLYTSGWLSGSRVVQVDQVAKVIGLKRDKRLDFAMTEHGDRKWPPRLLHVKDADDVLGAITLHERFFENVLRRGQKS